jgi:mono/diheme cytochrome c family protein
MGLMLGFHLPPPPSTYSRSTALGCAFPREVIANGTPRMPGFEHHFAPAEIDAIAAYVQTLPPAEKR